MFFVLARLLNERLLLKPNQIKGIEPLHVATDFFAYMGVGISVIFCEWTVLWTPPYMVWYFASWIIFIFLTLLSISYCA
nr:MAG TPA: hypothetical protein [Caudoviricetes sp.]